MKFCKNCGAELRDHAKVCTQCGTKQNSEDKETKSDEHAYQKKEPTQHPKEPMDPKKKKILLGSVGGVIALAIVLFIAYQVLESVYSPDSMMDDFSNAVTNEDAESLKSAVSTDISDEEANAFISLVDNEIGFSQFENWVGDAKMSLNDDMPLPDTSFQGYNLFDVQESGKHLGLFEDYDIALPKYNVMTNSTDLIDTFTYELNDETVEWAADEEKFGELIPGKYSFSGTGIKDDESFDSQMTVDFADHDSSSGIYGELEVNLFYLTFDVPVMSSYQYDISEDDITLSVNGEELEEDSISETDFNFVGPYQLGEDYEVTGTLNYEDESFDMSPETLNLSGQDIQESNNSDTPYYEVNVEFDSDELQEHYEDVQEQEAIEERRDDFEDNMESEVESFLRSYFRSLQSMYREEDVSEVEDYIESGSNIESTFQSNIESGTFEGMTITGTDFSNYEEDDGTITIDVSTRRNYDSIDSSTEFNNRYTIEYDSEDLSFTITNFVDL